MRKESEFIKELDKRLRENKRLVEGGIWPERFKGPLGILGWYFWEINLMISFFISVGLLLFWLPKIIKIAKRLLFLG